MSKKKNTLLRNTSILMAATIISRVIGLLYRSPLGETIGNEGLGYYSTASNLYTILLLISSYSIPMAVSKIVSERLALKEYRNAHRVFHGALLYAVIVGGVAALVAFFGGKFLLPYNQQNALLALRVLAPTIFFSAVLGVLRGYFQAHSTMMPTSISQIIEQVFNAAFSIGAAWFFIQQFATNDTEHAKFGAAGGTLGTGAGVLAGLCFMLIVYGVNRKTILRKVARDTRHREESYREIFQVLFLMVTPVIFTTFIYNCNAYLDNYLFFTILGWHGENQKALNAAYGEFSNYYVTLINVPLAMASASASAMMPEVSSCYATGDLDEANDKILETIRLTMFISIPAAVGLEFWHSRLQAFCSRQVRAFRQTADDGCRIGCLFCTVHHYQQCTAVDRAAEESLAQCGNFPWDGSYRSGADPLQFSQRQTFMLSSLREFCSPLACVY